MRTSKINKILAEISIYSKAIALLQEEISALRKRITCIIRTNNMTQCNNMTTLRKDLLSELEQIVEQNIKELNKLLKAKDKLCNKVRLWG